MREVDPSHRFEKDYGRELRGRYKKILMSGLLDEILEELANDRPLKAKHKDHDLTGNWKGCRECHIKPDLLLIYEKIGDDYMRLIRLGSHSELFK